MSRAFSLLLSLSLVAVQAVQGAIEKSSMATDSTKPDPSRIAAEYKATTVSFPSAQINTGIIKEMSGRSTAFQGELGFSKHGRAITAYYFPGKSEKRALIIGGMHGSELSGIEVARKIIADLQKENRAHYSVIIIPCLFPDNEVQALQPPGKKKQASNAGRYTHKDAADPNRQMPALGKPLDHFNPKDYLGRDIEHENQVLLHLISAFMPHRIANIHAIRDIWQAGIFADPRTDSEGYALGFESDSSLAISMAKYIYENGGNVAGNRLDSTPTALYYNDPFIAQRGNWQPRNLTGVGIPGDRGQGVSLGGWASTAICDTINLDNSRQAMRLITIEFPGYKRPADYSTADEQEYHKQLVDLYASSIESLFLGSYFEEESRDGCDCIKK